MSYDVNAARTITIFVDRVGFGVGNYDNGQSFVDSLRDQAAGLDVLNNAGQVVGAISSINPVTGLVGNSFALSITLNKTLNDGMTIGDAFSIAGNVVAIVGAGLVIGATTVNPLVVGGLAMTGLAIGLTQLRFNEENRSKQIKNPFDDAKSFLPYYDPLMLDLDGDGLELKRADGSILFDHNADGIKTGSGWLNSDDGILVRDLNGDGAITPGRELFGADTLKLNGQLATNGFDALADLDANHDGNFTNADAAWSSVKVWRDLDQDGVSDAGELFTLDQLGISRIGVVGSATNPTGGTQAGTTVNANLIAQSASFTQTVNGTATTRTVGSVDLESNAFYREFTTQVPVTAQAAALPQMQGSGRARDLDESASLSPALAMSLSVYSLGATRDVQIATKKIANCASRAGGRGQKCLRNVEPCRA